MLGESDSSGVAWNAKNYRNLIISVALTGAVPQKKDHTALPVTPQEIADAVEECAAEGAQVFHIHLRNAGGEPLQSQELYEETFALIRERCSEVVVCATTSSRGGAPLVERMASLDLPSALLPEMASLSLGSFNFPGVVSHNPPSEIEALAMAMRDRGVVPELEVFEPGMLSLAHLLISRGILPSKPVINILLGNKGSSALTAQGLSPFLAQLPNQSEWALAGIGRFQQKAMFLGVALGGNIRIGMEDDPVGDGSGQWSNLSAVRKAKAIAELAGRPLASFAETRARLGLRS